MAGYLPAFVSFPRSETPVALHSLCHCCCRASPPGRGFFFFHPQPARLIGYCGDDSARCPLLCTLSLRIHDMYVPNNVHKTRTVLFIFFRLFFLIETNWFFQFITSRRCSFLANDCSQIKRNNCTADLVSHTLKKPPFALFPPVYSTAAPFRIVSRVRTRISTDG